MKIKKVQYSGLLDSASYLDHSCQKLSYSVDFVEAFIVYIQW